MVRIPVYTQDPVRVVEQNVEKRLKRVEGGLSAGVTNILPDLGSTDSHGRKWRLKSLLVWTATAGVGGSWVDINLTYEPSNSRMMWLRFSIPAVNSGRISLFPNASYGSIADAITPSQTYICPIPDLWLDDDYYWSVLPSADAGNYVMFYEEIRD